MNRITFRLDDITADMNWDNFRKLDTIFSKYQVYPLLGVVPDNQDDGLKKGKVRQDFWEYLKELQRKGYLISQHGCCHVYETKNSGILKINPFSEFAGLSLEKQDKKIRQGQEILKKNNLKTDIFMAPGHTFDENTLQALKNNGFKAITDGYTHYPYCYRGLNFYPSTLSEVREQKGVDTVCLHLNLMNDADIKDVETFIQKHLENKKNKVIVCSYKEMIANTKVKSYNMFTALTIKHNLWVRELKDFIANDQSAIIMMQKTAKMGKIKKNLCRVVYTPKLFTAFFKSRITTRQTLEGKENDTGNN